jgi:gamma-glutamylcyclotransferase (GGCT)/AIG2-like uncharacterized protein YtfP
MSRGGDRVAVFTYGSLMYDAVWRAIVPSGGTSLRGRVEGWRRCALRGASYPGLVASPGGSVSGRLWLDVAPADLARLDAFEGDEYRREAVRVLPDDGSPPRIAQAWIWLDASRLLEGDWDPVVFEREHLAGFAQAHGAQD